MIGAALATAVSMARLIDRVLTGRSVENARDEVEAAYQRRRILAALDARAERTEPDDQVPLRAG